MSGKNGNDGWRGFSNVPLNAAQKKAAKALKWGGKECFAYLQMLLDAGYKVTFTADGENHAYAISATGRVDNVGLTMSQRHADLYVAVEAHSVAHFQVTEERWPDPMQPTLDLDW